MHAGHVLRLSAETEHEDVIYVVALCTAIISTMVLQEAGCEVLRGTDHVHSGLPRN